MLSLSQYGDRADCPLELTVLTLPESVIVETGLLGMIAGMEKQGMLLVFQVPFIFFFSFYFYLFIF